LFKDEVGGKNDQICRQKRIENVSKLSPAEAEKETKFQIKIANDHLKIIGFCPRILNVPDFFQEFEGFIFERGILKCGISKMLTFVVGTYISSHHAQQLYLHAQGRAHCCGLCHKTIVGSQP
jgi:hypothetical protein